MRYLPTCLATTGTIFRFSRTLNEISVLPKRTFMSFLQPENATQHYISQLQTRLQELLDHVRENVQQVDELKAKALFEKTAEVLSGLIKDFSNLATDHEGTWQEQKTPIK